MEVLAIVARSAGYYIVVVHHKRPDLTRKRACPIELQSGHVGSRQDAFTAICAGVSAVVITLPPIHRCSQRWRVVRCAKYGHRQYHGPAGATESWARPARTSFRIRQY